MPIHMHQEWKKKKNTEKNIDNKAEIKYLRMNQQEARMITM